MNHEVHEEGQYVDRLSFPFAKLRRSVLQQKDKRSNTRPFVASKRREKAAYKGQFLWFVSEGEYQAREAPLGDCCQRNEQAPLHRSVY